jgi:hypothetical protein
MREVLYDILTDFGITVKLVDGLKQGDALPLLLFNLSLEYAIRKVKLNEERL